MVNRYHLHRVGVEGAIFARRVGHGSVEKDVQHHGGSNRGRMAGEWQE